MEDKLEESSEAHGPSSLMHAAVSNKTEVLSQTMRKGKTNTRVVLRISHVCHGKCVPAPSQMYMSATYTYKNNKR